MRYLLDTNVLSEAIRTRPHSRVLSWLTQNHSACALSVISVGEIWKAIESLPPRADAEPIMRNGIRNRTASFKIGCCRSTNR